jgi:N-acetylneuraminic acid mutarotase
MKNAYKQSSTFQIWLFFVNALSITILLSLSACEKWDLDINNFVEVLTSETIIKGENSTETIVFGEIKGLAEGSSVDQHGHIWSSTNDVPTLENKEGQTTFLKRDNEEFSSTIEGLSPSIVYYYRAYALHEDQLFYGTVRTFSTDPFSFNAVVDSIYNINQFIEDFQADATISISGFEQGILISDFGVVWGNQPQPTLEEDQFSLKGSTITDGLNITFNANLTELQPGLNYVRPYLIIGEQLFYGNEAPLPISDVWTKKTDFGDEGEDYAIGFSINEKGYMVTHYDPVYLTNDFWEYDPLTDVWTQKADFAGEGRQNAVGFAINEKGYVGTGTNGSKSLKDFWEYDPQADVWKRRMDFEGEIHRAVGFSINDKGYVGTGVDNDFVYTKDFWEYDPQEDAWTKKKDFAGGARRDAVGFSINDKGYMCTGVNDEFPYTRVDFWEYDPQTDTWTKKADLVGGARRNAVGFSINNKGYMGTGSISGDIGTYLSNDIWEYDPLTNAWTQKGDLAIGGRGSAIGFSIGNKGYAGGGYGISTSPFKDFWEYVPKIE